LSFEFLKKQFEQFLSLKFVNRFFITYFLSWFGLFGTLSIAKLLQPLFNVESASLVTTAKYEAISNAVSSQIGFNYYSVWFTYFISNYIACISIFLAFVLLAHLYTRDISKGKSTIKDYFNTLLFFYLLVVINPFTGVLGVNLQYSDILAIIPHGIFEYAGFSLSIVLGIEYALIKLPISGIKKHYEKKQKVIFMLKFISIPLLILLAGFLETLDWLIFNYAKENNLSILYTFFDVYYSILKSLII